MKARRRRWLPSRVTCQACWAAGFRQPVAACATCQARKARKARRRVRDAQLLPAPWVQERIRSDADCAYHSAWPCGECDDCEDWRQHPADVVPLCPGWSRCTCLTGTAGHQVAASLEGLND